VRSLGPLRRRPVPYRVPWNSQKRLLTDGLTRAGIAE
jgi:hypothetical protein